MKIIEDPATGVLGAIEFSELEFEAKRIYWIRDFKAQTTRGNHAHKLLRQLAIVIQGSLSIEIFQGENMQVHRLNQSGESLMIEPGQWRVMKDASPNTVLLVIASHEYDESDYIREWDEYLEWYREHA